MGGGSLLLDKRKGRLVFPFLFVLTIKHKKMITKINLVD